MCLYRLFRVRISARGADTADMRESVAGEPEGARDWFAALKRQVGSAGPQPDALAVIDRVTDAIVSEGPLEGVLDGIVRATAELLGADRGSLMLIEPDRQQMCIHASVGIPPSVVKRARTRLGAGIAGGCAASGAPVLIRDIRELRSHLGAREARSSLYRTQSAICVPLRIRSETLGVLNINDRRDGEQFTTEDLFVAQIIARQAAVAISNSRLLTQVSEAVAAHRSLEIARGIQQSLIPPDLEIPGAWVSGHSVACEGAGGDYVDFWSAGASGTETGASLYLAIGDVSGHGVGAALLMASGRAFLRALLSQSRDLSLVMSRLNQLIGQDLQDGHFMTLFVGHFDPAAEVLSYASAGHDPPLVQRAGGGGQCELRATGPPLGVLDDALFPTRRVRVAAGDLVALTTDGVWETRDGQGESFGRERLGRALREHCDETPPAVIRGIERRVVAHAHPLPPADDLSLLVLRREEGGAR